MLDDVSQPRLFWKGKGQIDHIPLRRLRLAAGASMWHGSALVHGDNGLALKALLQPEFRQILDSQGGLKLVYIDPPFCTGQKFSGSGRPAYADFSDQNEYLTMLYERLLLIRELIADNGSLYVHCDWRASAYVRLLLDEIFGHHVNEIIWHYTGGGRSSRRFSRKHDTIFIYSKSTHFTYNGDKLRLPYKPGSGYAKSGIRARSGKRYLPDPRGTLPDDVWDIPIVNPLAGERLGYPTQKPEALLERIILASSNPGDWIADFFCGSGVACAVAERLGRKWIGVDNGRLAISTTLKRLRQLQASSNIRTAKPGAFGIYEIS